MYDETVRQSKRGVSSGTDMNMVEQRGMAAFKDVKSGGGDARAPWPIGHRHSQGDKPQT